MSFDHTTLLELFIANREEGNCEEVTLRNYRRAIGALLTSGRMPEDVETLEPTHITLWFADLRHGGMSPAQRQWYQRHTFAFLHWLYDNDYVKRDPRRGIRRIMVQDVRRPQVTQAEMMRMLSVAIAFVKTDGKPRRHYYRNIAILRMLWATGTRCRELADAQYQDVNMERRILAINYAKGKKWRDLPFDVATKRALLEYVREERGGEDGPLFLLSPNGIQQVVKRIAARAKVKVSPHAFRRGFARRMRQSGIALADTATLMGHETLSMTRIYSQEGEQEAAIDAYRRLIG